LEFKLQLAYRGHLFIVPALAKHDKLKLELQHDESRFIVIYDKFPLILEKIQVGNPAVLGGLGGLGG
jgi:hypothetical protein